MSMSMSMELDHNIRRHLAHFVVVVQSMEVSPLVLDSGQQRLIEVYSLAMSKLCPYVDHDIIISLGLGLLAVKQDTEDLAYLFYGTMRKLIELVDDEGRLLNAWDKPETDPYGRWALEVAGLHLVEGTGTYAASVHARLEI